MYYGTSKDVDNEIELGIEIPTIESQASNILSGVWCDICQRMAYHGGGD